MSTRSVVRVRRGDIVWARLGFPHEWSPALVRSVDDLGVAVSFFQQNDAVSVAPTYFVESEVAPFEDAFPSLAPRHNSHSLLHSALRLLGWRVISSLRCACQLGPAQWARDGPVRASEFDPVGLLGFVLDAAVSPWVEPPRLAFAVRVVAQVHAFRASSSVQHKKMYREARRTGDNLKLHSCSSLEQRMHSVTQEHVAVKPKEKCQIISRKGETNMVPSGIRRLKSTVSVSEGNLAHVFENKLLIIFKNPTFPPALDPVCIKRRRIDNKPVSFDVSLQIGEVEKNEGSACILKCTRPRIPDIMNLEPEGIIQQDNQASTHSCRSNMNVANEVKNMDAEKSQNLTSVTSFFSESSPKLVLGIHSNRCEDGFSAAEAKGLSGFNSSVPQERGQMSCNGNAKFLESKKSPRRNFPSSDCLVEDKDIHQGVASCSVLNSKLEKQPKAHVPFSSKSLHMKFPRDFTLPSKGQLIKKFSVFGSVDYSRTRVFCFTGSAQVVFLQESDAAAAYVYAKKKAWFGDTNVRFWLDPFDQKRRGFNSYPSAGKQSGSPLKSCLKNSNPLRQENRKKRRRVRFTMKT